MSSADSTTGNKEFLHRAVEAAIRIGFVGLLAVWCFQIVQPFVIPFIWGVIIAVAAYPGYRRLSALLGGRNGLAAGLFALLGLIFLIIPSVLLTETLVDNAQRLAEGLSTGTIAIPPPQETIGSWPLIGETLAQFWRQASENLQTTLHILEPQLKALGGWLLKMAAGAGIGILQFIAAIIIAAVLLANASGSHRATHAIAARLAGERGASFAELAEATVRSVTRGILGVALIQALLAGIGFMAVGVPGPGLLAVLCLLLSVIQIGVFPIVVPVVIYVFATADTFTAAIFLLWAILVSTIDNILKPMLLGRGVEAPMAVIFIGAIGGFLSSGIIGLFIGAVVLVLGYKLLLLWLEPDALLSAPAATPAPATGTADKK